MKMQPTDLSLNEFLATLDDQRQSEAQQLIAVMQKISGQIPVIWGDSIIGFGSQHYKYETGHEGDMPQLGFSPRKTNITIYFSEGFDRYTLKLGKLGKHKQSVSCLYINKLQDIDSKVLEEMLKHSYGLAASPQAKPTSVDEYVERVPAAARQKFDELRTLVKETLPNASEVLNYGIIGYKIDDKRARVYISGWKDHLAIYPVPQDEKLQTELKPHIKGKGTLWFGLDEQLPTRLIKKIVKALAA